MLRGHERGLGHVQLVWLAALDVRAAQRTNRRVGHRHHKDAGVCSVDEGVASERREVDRGPYQKVAKVTKGFGGGWSGVT
jgi:hypothetical protein